MPGTPFDGLTSIANTSRDALGLTNRSGGPNGPGRSIIIDEQGVANPRRIVLKGRAMPYQGVPWGGTQASKVTWYPGNPVATQQVLGPRENDTDMEGMWKDRFMPGSVIVTDSSGTGGAAQALPGTGSLFGNGEFNLAEEVVKLFNDIRRAGTILRVQWLSEVRFGIIKEFEADYDRPQDIRWSMSFEWHAWDDDQSTRSATEPVNSSSILDAFNKVVDAVSLAPSVARAVQANLVSTISEVSDLVGTLFSSLEVFDTVLDTPGAVVGSIRNNVGELDRLLTSIISGLVDVRWPNTASATEISGPSTNPIGSSRTRSSVSKQELEFDRWRRTTAAAAASLRRTASDAVEQRFERLNPKTTRIVEVSAGTTLYDLSRRFYGSPDFASYLAGVNGLSGASVAPGTSVRVPPRPTGVVSPNSLLGGRKKKDCGEIC